MSMESLNQRDTEIAQKDFVVKLNSSEQKKRQGNLHASFDGGRIIDSKSFSNSRTHSCVCIDERADVILLSS